MKEKDFQGWVVDLFTRYGWVVKHAPTPMRPVGGSRFVPDRRGRGLLDLLMVHESPPRLVFAECKGHGGVLSDDQKEMIRLLRRVADEVKAAVDYAAGTGWDGGYPVGVYVFQPGGEPLIEAIAAGRS